MKLTIAAIGRLKDGPERELFQRYWQRLEAMGRRMALTPITLVEIAESRAASAEGRSEEEARKLVAAVAGATIILLDERGASRSSEAFAQDLRKRRDSGTAALAFLIGGADGHGATARQAASSTFALGALTLTHGLARVVLAEQLYRAATIISGHPYHRA